MIKASELRIGNYTDKGCVTALPMGRQHSEWNIECDYHDYDFEEILPIPLTEEWLVRFGFEEIWEEDDAFPSYHIGHSFVLDEKFQPVDVGFPIARIKIEHVHQLQNLYFALTGEELKLKEA